MISDELFAPVGAGIELCYQTFGDSSAEPMLLVIGLGVPMTWWGDEFCTQLADAGFFVIRFDNRDAGRSSKLDVRVPRAALVLGYAGGRVNTPYAMSDLAADSFALLDHLGIKRAHLVGLSMGGMIVQTMAIASPERVKSMTSIMSTTGRRLVGQPNPQLFPTLLARRGAGRKSYVKATATLWKHIGSPAFPPDPVAVKERAEQTYDRGYNATAVLRQMLAVVTQPDRTDDLKQLDLPVLVIHGKADKMVHVSGGRATAAAIPGAELMLIDGMGHDLPPVLVHNFVAAIRRTAHRSSNEANSGQPEGRPLPD